MQKLAIIVAFFLTVCAGPVSAEKVKLNGVELDYVVLGEGPPLYLLHGGMESRDSFEKQIPILANHFTVVALDSREQGRSGPSDAQITYELMSSDVIALAEHLGHERISIMGLSDGGITAITTAICQPRLIERLVLLGATFHYDSYPEGVREFIASYKWDGSIDPQTYPGNFIAHYLTGNDDLSAFGELLNEMAVMWTTSPAFEKSDLAQIKSKTLVINGDHDDTVLDHALDLYNGIPNAQLFIVPNATHYALQEKPDLLNKVILGFLLETE